jgi:hypothetical protein
MDSTRPVGTGSTRYSSLIENRHSSSGPRPANAIVRPDEASANLSTGCRTGRPVLTVRPQTGPDAKPCLQAPCRRRTRTNASLASTPQKRRARPSRSTRICPTDHLFSEFANSRPAMSILVRATLQQAAPVSQSQSTVHQIVDVEKSSFCYRAVTSLRQIAMLRSPTRRRREIRSPKGVVPSGFRRPAGGGPKADIPASVGIRSSDAAF